MVTTETEHPPVEKLVAYGQGRLDDVESAAIESHLATCMACQQVVEDTPIDSLIETLREPVPAADEQSSESRPGLFTRLAAIVNPHEAKREPRPVAQPHQDVPAELRDHPRYEILEWLGAGGMGTVFKARHRLMDRVVALKVMNPRLLTEPVAVVRFQREVKAAAQLAHPHIVTAYDAEQVGGLHFLAMEYVEGQTLADVVDRHGPLPVHQACEYVRQAALGLQYAHEHGMVHRDIKPQNLVLTESGEVKVFDFGLARFVSETAEPGAESGVGKLLGSPDYMAPEQAGDAHRADIRADIYSLGCTLYHLLTGLPPFPGGNAVEKLSAHMGTTPLAITAIRPDVPAGLQAVVDRMLAKEPAQRYQTPGGVAAALEPFCQPPSVAPKKPRRTAGDFVRRHARRLTIAAVLLALLGLGGALAVHRIATNQGTLVIETDDPDVDVIVKQGGEQVTIVDAKSGREVTLKAGQYQLELAGGAKGLTLSTNDFRLTRGGKQIVTVRFEVAQGKPTPSPSAPDSAASPAAIDSLSDPIPQSDASASTDNWVFQLPNDHQTKMVSVVVLVVDLQGHPVARADVLAYCTPWDFVQRGKTGEDGRWTTRGPKGNWTFYAGSEFRSSEGVVAALRHARIEQSTMVTVMPDRQMQFVFESLAPSDILVRLTPTDLPSPVECIYCGSVKPNTQTTWSVSSGMSGIATLIQQPAVGQPGRLQFVSLETGPGLKPPNNKGPVGRVRFSLDSKLGTDSWWNFFFDPLEHEAGAQWPFAPRVRPGHSTYDVDVTPGQYRIWTDFHQASPNGSLQFGASFAPRVVTVHANENIEFPFSTQLGVRSVEVMAWNTTVHLWFDLLDAKENEVDWLAGNATLRIKKDDLMAYDGPVTGSSSRYIGLGGPLLNMRGGRPIEVEYTYDSPVVGRMNYRGQLPQDTNFVENMPVIAESEHFRFHSRNPNAFGKQALRGLETAYSWLIDNYAGAVHPIKSSRFEVGLWSGAGGATSAGETFGLDVYSAGKLVPNTCPEHGMGTLLNVFAWSYQGLFPHHDARNIESRASHANLIAAYCLRAIQGDRVFRQCRQIWSRRFFDYLAGKESDSGFSDVDRHAFIVLYIDARYGFHINRDFFRAVYPGEGNCAQLLGTMDFLANDHERTAALYSFLVGENLGWLYRWARLPVAEGSVDQAMSRLRQLKAAAPPPWPRAR